ncbi:MAG: uncharacterized protein PWP15_431 [Methanothermococcus sp.]|uniref:nucleotidyltransferase family protein n=1 Tax=Methanothermococcus TaxID=155862 RepID=UPI000376FA86|nr:MULTISPECIES: nucleotidyltransferase [Methanothermococcus]MDK2789924.1 uncharacterized protein [Methanothermococcus sp.]
MLTKRRILKKLIENRKEFKKFGVKKIGLFGSYVRNDAKEGSDIDIVVEFEEGKKNYDNFINLYYYLKELFGEDIDLLTKESLSKYIKEDILKEIEYV